MKIQTESQLAALTARQQRAYSSLMRRQPKPCGFLAFPLIGLFVISLFTGSPFVILITGVLVAVTPYLESKVTYTG